MSQNLCSRHFKNLHKPARSCHFVLPQHVCEVQFVLRWIRAGLFFGTRWRVDDHNRILRATYLTQVADALCHFGKQQAVSSSRDRQVHQNDGLRMPLKFTRTKLGSKHF